MENKKRSTRIDRQSYLENTYKLKIGEREFAEIMNADPTFNKQYAQWLLINFLKIQELENKKLFLEDLYKTTEDLKVFYKYNNRLPLEKRDINNIKDLKELYFVIKDVKENPEEFLSRTEILKETKKEIDVLLNNENCLVLIPKTKNASVIYGANTRWCTASAQYNHFESYTKDGPLYIIIDKRISSKHPEFKRLHKYQFHFESGQFMDAEDSKINFEEFLGSNRDLLHLFANINNGYNIRLKLMFDLPIEEHEKEINMNKRTLDLSSIQCEEIPENLIIHGDVSFQNSKNIKRIKNITVNGSLDLSGSSIETIEGKLYVSRQLDIHGCKNLKKLPDDFYVGTSLKALNADLECLPAGNIGGMAFFSYNSKISYIPDNLYVGGNLYVNNTLIPKLSESETRKFANIKGKIYSGRE